MGRIAVIGLMVLGIWVGLTVYNEGVDRAFGGIFAGFADSPAREAPDHRSTPNRAGDAFQRAFDKSESRVDAMLQDPAARE